MFGALASELQAPNSAAKPLAEFVFQDLVQTSHTRTRTHTHAHAHTHACMHARTRTHTHAHIHTVAT